MQSGPGQSEVHIKALPPGEGISQQLRTLAILQEVLSVVVNGVSQYTQLAHLTFLFCS